MERAALQQGVTEIGNASRCKTDTRVIKVVEVASQILVREVARYAGEVVHHPLPVDVSRFGELQQGGNLRIDFEKGDVRKGQRAVGHHALELHTQTFGIIADFHQVTAPIDSRLRRMEHLLRHHPYLGHDFLRHHPVDAPVVVVFRTAVPDAEVAQGFMLQELGREYPGGSDLRCRVVLEDVIDLLPVVPFGDRFRTEGSHHRRNGTGVVVHAVILGVNRLAECDRGDGQDKE